MPNSLSKQERKLMVLKYIQGPLAREIQLISGKRAKRTKKFFTAECYMKLQAFNWSNDWHVYVHEGARVDATNMINTHCYTSARLQEVCQARYRVSHASMQNAVCSALTAVQNFECHVGYFNGEPDIKIRFTREFCKGKDSTSKSPPLTLAT